MPGIVGIIRRRPYEGIDRDLRLMVESMRHEKFYVGNQYVNQDLGLRVGWLSHPGSLGENMPLISRDKRRVLIIGGEHFSHSHKAVAPNGNGFHDGRAHDLLRLYEESADKFFDSLNGWFSGVAVDLDLGKVTLFNDRYGMSRVYLHEGAEEFIFASEAKSFLRIRPSLRVIEPAALAESCASTASWETRLCSKASPCFPVRRPGSSPAVLPPKSEPILTLRTGRDSPTSRPKNFIRGSRKLFQGYSLPIWRARNRWGFP